MATTIERETLPRASRPTPEPPAEAETAKPKSSRGRVFLIMGVILLALVGFGARRWIYGLSHVSTDNAQVDGHVIPILPKVGGFVNEVRVDENNRVKAGDTLVVLDDRDYKVRLAQADADLGVALAAVSNRTFRYLALPNFPEGINGAPPGPFSILNDPGSNSQNGLEIGPPLPASDFQSVQGFAAFHPAANFRDPVNPANQNGIVFFPGAVPLYKTINGAATLVGGLGVSGDGVDQDDVVTFAAAIGYTPPAILTADNFFVRNVRLPYQKFDRNPDG